jgi:hypothetical protein
LLWAPCQARGDDLGGIATRYHKLDIVYLHMIYLACIHIMTK